MTFTEYLLNIGLVGLVVLQLRGRPITVRNLVLPLVITLWVASTFLKDVPTAGNDVVLEAAGALAGLALGSVAAMATTIRRQASGMAVAKAGAVAAALWVLGVGARIGFSLYVQHGGQRAVAHFSATHGITSGHAWAVAFVLMAITEVVSRTAVVFAKARLAGAAIPRRALPAAAAA